MKEIDTISACDYLDDGTCIKYNTEESCLHEHSIYDHNLKKCEWKESNQYCYVPMSFTFFSALGSMSPKLNLPPTSSVLLVSGVVLFIS